MSDHADDLRATVDQMASSTLLVAESHKSLITGLEKLEDQLASLRQELNLEQAAHERTKQAVFASEHDRDNARHAVALLEESAAATEAKLNELQAAVTEMKPSTKT